LLQYGWNFRLKLGGMKAYFSNEECAAVSKDQSKVVIEEG